MLYTEKKTHTHTDTHTDTHRHTHTCNIHRKTPSLESLTPATLLKKDSNAGFFSWILRSFLEHLFL